MTSPKLRTSEMVLMAPVAPKFSICPRRSPPPEPRLPPARFRRYLRLRRHAQRSAIPGPHGQNRSKPPPSPRLRRRNRRTAPETGTDRAVAVAVQAVLVADRAVVVAVQAVAVAVQAVVVAVQAVVVDRAVTKPCAPRMRPSSSPFPLSAAPAK